MRLVVTPPATTPEVANAVEMSIPNRGEIGRSMTTGIVVWVTVRCASPVPI